MLGWTPQAFKQATLWDVYDARKARVEWEIALKGGGKQEKSDDEKAEYVAFIREQNKLERLAE